MNVWRGKFSKQITPIGVGGIESSESETTHIPLHVVAFNHAGNAIPCSKTVCYKG